MENGCGWYAEVNSFRYLELDLDARKFRRAEVWKLASIVVEVVMVWAGWVCFGSGLMRICACFFFSFLFFYVVSIDRVCVLLVEIFLSSFCDILKVDFRSSQFWRTVTSLSFDQFILETQIEYIHE